MKKYFAILLVCFSVFSCDKNDDDNEGQNACCLTDPLEAVWLEEMSDTLKGSACERSVIQGTYKEQTVFFIALTDALCDGIDTPTLYDCQGNPVRTFTMDDYTEFYEQVSRDKVLYRSKRMVD